MSLEPQADGGFPANDAIQTMDIVIFKATYCNIQFQTYFHRFEDEQKVRLRVTDWGTNPAAKSLWSKIHLSDFNTEVYFQFVLEEIIKYNPELSMDMYGPIALMT
jgi:hypothetical protein